MLERETLGGSGSTGTKVRDNYKGKAPVKGKKAAPINFRYLDNSTTPFFFTNIPDGASNTILWKVFAQFGFVAEVFIPNKLDKWGHRFGFVKFLEVKDEEALVVSLEDVWIWNTKLKVNRARFGREGKKEDDGMKKQSVGGGEAGPSKGVSTGKTFKTALTMAPCLDSGKGATVPFLEISPSEGMLERLQRCYVGELVHEQEAEAVQMGLVMEGLTKVKATRMGAGSVLLEFEDQADFGRVKQNHKVWWNAVFKKVKN